MSQPSENLAAINAAEHIGPNSTGDNIPAKRTANYVWDSGSSSWVRMTQPGGGTGGAGDASAANQVTGNASLASIDGKITAVNTGAVVVSSSALPSGAATGAKQDTGNTSLASIDTKTPSLGQAVAGSSSPVVLPAAQITTLTPPAAITNFANETGGNLASIKTNTDKIPSLGQALAAASVPVVLTAAQLTTLTPQTTALTDTQLRASAVPVSLAAETTKVIGVVRNSDGAGNLLTSNSTTFTAKFAQDANLLGTLGTAFTTAGKVDVKAADGDVFVRQATGTNLHTVVDSGTITSLTQMNGVAITLNKGASDTGTQRVTLGDGAQTIGALTANQSVNNAQIAGVATSVNQGVSDTGTQRVAPVMTASGTVLASASRGVATVNTDLVNVNGKGIRVWQDLTVLGASSVVTFTIQEKDPVSGKFVTILASAATGAGINSTGTAKLTVYPGLTAAANSIANDVLPVNIRIVSTVATAASTFSIGYSIIP
jgi:hypothetical protein